MVLEVEILKRKLSERLAEAWEDMQVKWGAFDTILADIIQNYYGFWTNQETP